MSKKPCGKKDAQSERDEVAADLRALIAALDRRVPRIERAGERKIARDASVLKQQAIKRLEALRLQDG